MMNSDDGYPVGDDEETVLYRSSEHESSASLRNTPANRCISGNSLLPTSRRSSSAAAASRSPSPLISSIHNHGSAPSWISIVREFTLSVLILAGGYYIPRQYMSNETVLQKRPPPFQVTSAGDVILDFALNQPLVMPPTIPSDVLIWTSVWIPLLVLILLEGCCCVSVSSSFASMKHRLAAVVRVAGGLCVALGVSESATNALKLYIARRRPNFYALCGFDMTTRTCTASIDHVREAQYSFPSGHSSLSSCSMIYVTCYLWHRLSVQRGAAHKAQGQQTSTTSLLSLSIALALPGWAVFVGATRLVDTWHHYSDVIAGLLLGSAIGAVVYFQHYHYTGAGAIHGATTSSAGGGTTSLLGTVNDSNVRSTRHRSTVATTTAAPGSGNNNHGHGLLTPRRMD